MGFDTDNTRRQELGNVALDVFRDTCNMRDEDRLTIAVDLICDILHAVYPAAKRRSGATKKSEAARALLVRALDHYHAETIGGEE